ncbi:hypothetical protein GEMRC1_004761 [Eukaryota sp. GEM-RC1]
MLVSNWFSSIVESHCRLRRHLTLDINLNNITTTLLQRIVKTFPNLDSFRLARNYVYLYPIDEISQLAPENQCIRTIQAVEADSIRVFPIICPQLSQIVGHVDDLQRVFNELSLDHVTSWDVVLESHISMIQMFADCLAMMPCLFELSITGPVLTDEVSFSTLANIIQNLPLNTLAFQEPLPDGCLVNVSAALTHLAKTLVNLKLISFRPLRLVITCQVSLPLLSHCFNLEELSVTIVSPQLLEVLPALRHLHKFRFAPTLDTLPLLMKYVPHSLEEVSISSPLVYCPKQQLQKEGHFISDWFSTSCVFVQKLSLVDVATDALLAHLHVHTPFLHTLSISFNYFESSGSHLVTDRGLAQVFLCDRLRTLKLKGMSLTTESEKFPLCSVTALEIYQCKGAFRFLSRLVTCLSEIQTLVMQHNYGEELDYGEALVLTSMTSLKYCILTELVMSLDVSFDWLADVMKGLPCLSYIVIEEFAEEEDIVDLELVDEFSEL